MVVGRWAKVLGTCMLAAAWPKAFAEEGVIVDLEPPAEQATAAADAPDVIEEATPDAAAEPKKEAAEDPKKEAEAAKQPAPPKEAEVKEAPAAAPAAEDSEAPRKRYSSDVLSFDKWENALDLKATSMFDRKATNFNSPTVLLTAEWNYHLRSDTYIGLALSGTPQKASVSTSDGSTSDYTTYYGGLDIGQAVYSKSQYRAVLQLTGGYGVVYLRNTPAGSGTSTIDKPQYNFIEPGVFFTFLDYKTLDIGVVFTYRAAHLIVKSDVVQNKDVSSATFGLTFRSRHH